MFCVDEKISTRNRERAKRQIHSRDIKQEQDVTRGLELNTETKELPAVAEREPVQTTEKQVTDDSSYSQNNIRQNSTSHFFQPEIVIQELQKSPRIRPIIRESATSKCILREIVIQELQESPRIRPIIRESTTSKCILTEIRIQELRESPRISIQMQVNLSKIKIESTDTIDKNLQLPLPGNDTRNRSITSVEHQSSPSPHSEGDSDQPPIEDDIFDKIFSIGDGTIDDGKPTLICIINEKKGDNFFGLIETLCQRIYREKHGGFPESYKITDPDELGQNLTDIQASGNILSIQLKEKDWNEFFDLKENKGRFENRINQLYSQGLGFIIINTPYSQTPGAHNINIVHIPQPDDKFDKDFKKGFTRIAWAFVQIDDNVESWEDIFENGRMEYEKTLKSILSENGGRWDLATTRGSNESKEHFAIKCFIVKMLAKKYFSDNNLKKYIEPWEIKKIIKTEHKIEQIGVIPDVISHDDKEVYEIETLFSGERQNHSVIKTIAEKIENYKDIEEIKTINIVFENITLLRHLKDIRTVLKSYKKWEKEHGKDICIWTLNLKKGELVSLQDFQKQISVIV